MRKILVLIFSMMVSIPTVAQVDLLRAGMCMNPSGNWIFINAATQGSSLGYAPAPFVGLYGSTNGGSAGGWFPLKCDANGNLTSLPPGWTVTGSGSTQVVTAPGTVAVGTSVLLKDGSVRASLLAFGAKCDDTTDDTAALNSALSYLYAAGGGTLQIPRATCLISGSVVLPNNGNISAPNQPTIRITGMGNSANGYWGTTLLPGSALDLQYNASVAKIDTRGVGVLEIDHLMLMDGGTDCAPIIQTTNTTLYLHNDTFSGSTSGASACNDAIVLGGTDITMSNSPTAPFQGYGTVIEQNFFSKTRRAVYGRVYANAVVIRDNTVGTSCGSSLTDGSPYEFDSTMAPGGQTNAGNVLEGNLVEDVHYAHMVKCLSCVKSSFLANNSYDEGTSYLSAYYMGQPGTGYNTIIAGMNTDIKPLVTGADTTNTYITSHQSQPTFYGSGGPYIFNSANSGIQMQGMSAVKQWDFLNPSTLDEWYTQYTPGYQNWFFAPLGGTPENWLTLHRVATGAYVLSSPASSNYFQIIGTGSVSVLSAPGHTLTLGDTTNAKVQISANTLRFLINGTPASAGVVNLFDTDSIAWKNHAANNDLLLAKNATDQLTWTGVPWQLATAPGQAANFTSGTGVTSVACTSGYTCTNTRGDVTIVGGTATTGTIATVNFSVTLSAAPGLCRVTQNGGATLINVGEGIPSTSGFTITAGASVAGSTVMVDYVCQP